MNDPGQTSRSGAMPSHDEQIAELKAQLEALMRERVNSAAEQMAAKTGEIADQLRDYAREKTDAVAHAVSDRPLTAIAVAAAIGFLVGRMR